MLLQTILDTTIAELIKEETDSEKFLSSLQTEQELMLGVDTDKVHPFIEDCIAHQEPLIKVLKYSHYLELFYFIF